MSPAHPCTDTDRHRDSGRAPVPYRLRTATAIACRCALYAGLLLSSACGRTGAPPRAVGLSVADSLVADAVANGTVPGAVLLVARDDEVLLEAAYGFAQLMELEWTRTVADQVPREDRRAPLAQRAPEPMTPGIVFDLASVTKVMATTMAVMLLVDRGRVELDTPVYRYLPAFRGPHADSITLRHLLTHSAGLVQWQPIYYSATNGEEALSAIAGMPLQWGVGAERHYSDLGFMLLGYLVERVSGMALDRFVTDELYRPLGLERTGFRPPGCSECPGGPFAATSHGNPYEYRMVHDTTFGYRYAGDPESWHGWRRYTLVGEVNDGNAYHAHGGVAGHAGLFSTAGDLARLLRLLLDEGELDGRQWLRPETVRTFLQPTEFGQALGWQTPPWAPQGSFSHTGFTGTFVMGIPSERLAIVLLTNRQHLGVDADTRYPDLSELQQGVVRAVVEAGVAR